MTPFVIWLNKKEVDELIQTLIRSDQSINNNKIFMDNELLTFAEDLMRQNSNLLNLLKKIELLEPSKVTDYNIQRFFKK